MESRRARSRFNFAVVRGDTGGGVPAGALTAAAGRRLACTAEDEGREGGDGKSGVAFGTSALAAAARTRRESTSAEIASHSCATYSGSPLACAANASNESALMPASARMEVRAESRNASRAAAGRPAD